MRASVSVLTAKLDLPVPSGNCPFGPVPKGSALWRAGYESEILSSGVFAETDSRIQAECRLISSILHIGTSKGTI